MSQHKKKRSHGQAMVEYLVVFSFMAIVGIKMVIGLQGFMKVTVGGLNRALTSQLTSGVCTNGNCFFKGYSNGI